MKKSFPSKLTPLIGAFLAFFPLIFGGENYAANKAASPKPSSDQHVGDTEHFRYWQYLILPERDIVFYPNKVVALSGVQRGDVVADIGSASGYFTFRFARAVGPEGRVFAVDFAIPLDLQEYLAARITAPETNPFRNVELVKNRPDDIALPPNSIDLAFMCLDAILLIDPQEVVTTEAKMIFDGQRKMVRSIFKALKPQGRLVIIDLFAPPGEEPKYPQIYGQMGPFSTARSDQTAITNFESLGFRFVKGYDFLRNEEHARDVAYLKSLPIYQTYGEDQKYSLCSEMFFMIFEKPPIGEEQPVRIYMD